MLGLREDGAIQTVSKVEKKWDTNDNNKNCKAKNIAKDFLFLIFSLSALFHPIVAAAAMLASCREENLSNNEYHNGSSDDGFKRW